MKTFEKACLLRDAGAVKRYHTVRMTRDQRVSEHSFNMLLLLEQVWPEAPARVLRAVIYHDLPELITGDTPATAKHISPTLSLALDELEKGCTELTYGVELSPYENAVLKWCDWMELAMHCMEEVNMGNMYALVPAANVLNWIPGSMAFDLDKPTGLQARRIFNGVLRTMRNTNTTLPQPYEGVEDESE